MELPFTDLLQGHYGRTKVGDGPKTVEVAGDWGRRGCGTVPVSTVC